MTRGQQRVPQVLGLALWSGACLIVGALTWAARTRPELVGVLVISAVLALVFMLAGLCPPAPRWRWPLLRPPPTRSKPLHPVLRGDFTCEHCGGDVAKTVGGGRMCLQCGACRPPRPDPPPPPPKWGRSAGRVVCDFCEGDIADTSGDGGLCLRCGARWPA